MQKSYQRLPYFIQNKSYLQYYLPCKRSSTNSNLLSIHPISKFSERFALQTKQLSRLTQRHDHPRLRRLPPSPSAPATFCLCHSGERVRLLKALHCAHRRQRHKGERVRVVVFFRLVERSSPLSLSPSHRGLYRRTLSDRRDCVRGFSLFARLKLGRPARAIFHTIYARPRTICAIPLLYINARAMWLVFG